MNDSIFGKILSIASRSPLPSTIYIILPILEHMKGGGIEFFYQFTITRIQISDPIIFVLSQTPQKIPFAFITLYFVMIFLQTKKIMFKQKTLN